MSASGEEPVPPSIADRIRKRRGEVDPAAWGVELERIGPKLRQRGAAHAARGGGAPDWSARLAQTGRHAATLRGLVGPDGGAMAQLAAVGGGSFGDEPADAFAFLGSASFHADVSLGDGAGGLITADSDAVFRARFSAVGALVRLGDNASTDRLEITAETHVLAGLLHAHGDSQVGDTALCTDAEGKIFD